MQETGVRNGAFGADKFGLKNLRTVHWNLQAPQLYQHSLSAGEAVLSACNTIAGDKPGAEALSGLARAFFYAGARAPA